MLVEREWVKALQPELQASLANYSDVEWRVEVSPSVKLTYAHEILLYHGDVPGNHRSAKYETDLLIYDIRDGGDWIPRVVVECKLGSVTTHDALTYSTKAATHKHVHPYLRYGILIGAFGSSVPGRLIRHGAFFDFMMVSQTEALNDNERSDLINLLAKELQASRLLQALLTENRTRGRKRYRLLHRPLQLTELDEVFGTDQREM